jgi:hypothetical protein
MGGERELLTPVSLCDSSGQLNPAAVGWSRRPLHACNLKGHWLRKKRWNYWCVTTDRHLISVTLSNLDYAGLAFVYALAFETGQFTELTVMKPFGRGCDLPETVTGRITFRHPDLNCDLADDGERVRISVSSPRFGSAPLAADFQVERPPYHESMNVVIPWSARRFQFTSKQQCLPAAGQMRFGEKTVVINPGEGFACLDFGRGVWPYRSVWNWAAFSGWAGGHMAGINFGGRWTDGTGMTENAIVVDGRVSKLAESVDFQYNPKAFQHPWRLRTRESSRIDLTFTPFYERVARSSLLLLHSEVHQLIGRFAGTLQTDSGETVTVRDVVGWAEEHQARW